MAASSVLFPRLKIQDIPDLVDLDHLHKNGKLLSDAKLAEIKPKLLAGRNKSRDLGTSYDVARVGEEYFAIYKSATSGKALGSGKFGIVKLAQNLVTGEWAALKVVKESSVITREVEILKIVNQLIGWYQRKNKYGNKQFEIFMPLAPGINLRTIAKESIKLELTTVEYIEIFITILELCDNLLTARIIHRDVKDENIIIDVAKCILTLVDYGLAARMDDFGSYISSPGTGTSIFLAPEVRDDFKRRSHERVPYNEKTEIFAFAITVGRLLGLTFDPIFNVFIRDSAKALSFETKIPEVATQTKIISQLRSMVEFDQAQRPTVQSSITHFKAIRDELSDSSRIIAVGCVDVNDYTYANKLQQKIMRDWLLQMKRVCLVDMAGTNKILYLKLKRHLEVFGLVVLDEVVQYHDRKVDMPLAIATYLNSLPHADTRYYTGYFILDEKQIENVELQRALNKNGIMYVKTEDELFNPSLIRHCGEVIKRNFISECTQKLVAERERLASKNEKKFSENREKRIAALRQTVDDVDDMMMSGWVRVGVFGNFFARLDKAITTPKADKIKKAKTGKLLIEIDDLIREKIDQELLEHRPAIHL